MNSAGRGTRLVALVALAGGAAPAPVQAQNFDLGPHVPGVRVGVLRDAYDVTGSTAEQILRQLVRDGPPSWTRYPVWFTWSYDAERIPLASGIPSTSCRFTDFELVLDFTAVHPRWDPPPEAGPELREAWSVFEQEIEHQWVRQRDEYVVRATEAVRRSRRHEARCPFLVQGFHNVIEDLLDWSRHLDGHETPEPLSLSWPPGGYEHLLTVDPELRASDSPPAPELEEGAGDPDPFPDPPTVAVRPGRPRPITTPAPNLDFAIQTDLKGTVPTGFVAGLYHQETLQYLDAFGTHPETGEAVTLDTPVPIPAFTQVLVSTLAVALGEAGIVDLDAPISTYVDVSPGLGRATTRQLLEHRAGLDNAPPRDSTMAWDRVLDRLNDRALFTEPGALPSYSSYSFGLATRVIERATRATLEDVLQRTLLDPLGMRSTSLGERDEEGVVDGLPITRTSAADMLRFWMAWLGGSIAGAGVDLLPAPSERTLAPDGREFRGGVWVDRPGAVPRLSLMCGTDLARVTVEVFPVTHTVLMVIGFDGSPLHTATFMLDALGRSLRIDNAIFGPVPLVGVAGFGRRARPCRRMSTSRAHRPVDFGPRAEAADWVGRYVNGDWFFALEQEGGLLVSPRPEGAPWNVHHFEGDTYFASVPREEGSGVGFPFRLFRGPEGRRYLMLDDRAYVHEEDLPAR